MSVIIRCTDLHKRFGSTLAVNGVSLDVNQGEVLSLVGPSGCGKTTTLRLIAGFESPDSGSIEIGGKVVVDGQRSAPPEERRVGMVFQDYALFPHMTVADNIAFGLFQIDESARNRVIDDVLYMVGLTGQKQRHPYELSGGQQQRVALARALAPKPTVILLDEPFSNIDATLRARVRAEVRDILSSAGATAVFVTHDKEEALSIADRVAVLWEGKVLQIDTPERIYNAPATREVAQFVGDMDTLPGEATNGHVSCELGQLSYAGHARGIVDVFIQPELVLLSASSTNDARIVRREFFGHDQRYTVQLASGNTVRSRTGNEVELELGATVDISVQGAVLAFPSRTSTSK